jgi:hypothetical protein
MGAMAGRTAIDLRPAPRPLASCERLPPLHPFVRDFVVSANLDGFMVAVRREICGMRRFLLIFRGERG